ncbi:diguanylate cyclase [Methylophaga thalassica]|uniref:diguanylate cyclase n=1 Tax=Methylophaga aminisulfidivorans TaxID=230105 RepID=UPI003A8D128F
MTAFIPQQLRFVIAEIDKAIDSHQQWYQNLLRVLVSRVSPDEKDRLDDAHQQCQFGQWYHTPQADLIQDHPTFISLGVAHENMHKRAKQLIDLVLAKQSIPVELFDAFNDDLEKMRVQFYALRHEFADLVQNLDPLTGAQTRAGMQAELNKEHALAKRSQQPSALVMLDIDHFKNVNDRYGHAVGDLLLTKTVQSIQHVLRPYDQLYRYGGEEFLICMPNTTLEQAQHVAERMREVIAEQKITYDKAGSELYVTASLGVTSLDPAHSVEDAINMVDKAMYEAKSGGRNLVRVR